MAEPPLPNYPPLNRVLSPPLNLHPPNSPPDLYSSAVEHFTSIPWCAALLEAPVTIPFIPQARNPFSPQHDQLFGRTLANDRALCQMLCFIRADAAHLRDPQRPITEVSTLFALGVGLSGYPSVLHGGMAMAMVDEAMGIIAEINMALGKVAIHGSHVTGSLEIKFLKMIPAQGVVCATASLESVEGRKRKIKCVLKDGQDTALVACTSTWIALRPKV